MEKFEYLINKTFANIEVYGLGGIVAYTGLGVAGVLLTGSAVESGLHDLSNLIVFNGSGMIGTALWTSSTTAKKVRDLLI